MLRLEQHDAADDGQHRGIKHGARPDEAEARPASPFRRRSDIGVGVVGDQALGLADAHHHVVAGVDAQARN